ncbi:MAG: lipolytic enzyme, G-D-S-L [Thalassobium sp.]|nr:MAG: lipolytic enzyme, G-D-S-L [Thalassobium sp.]
MPTLLTFGDSNTHGNAPFRDTRDYQRFDPQTRWPTLAARALGDDWTLIEEDLPGRTTAMPDPVMGAHMDGREGLKMALASHGSIDWLTIMLGTNDSKARFGASAEAITAGLASLVDIAMQEDIQQRHGGFDILLICPPVCVEAGLLADEFIGCEAKSRALAPLLEIYAKTRGMRFLDAGAHIAVSPSDGVHFEAESHAVLAKAVAAAIT